MLIAARNGMLVESGFTARDYVQDGLVAMWDGIENAGWGVHDPDLPIGEWKNLGSGNVALEYAAADLDEAWAWTGDGARIVDGAKANIVRLRYRVPVDPTDGDFTLDYCVSGATSSMANFYMRSYGLGTFRFYRRGTTTGMYVGGIGGFSTTPGLANASVVSRPSATLTLGYSNGALAQRNSYAIDAGDGETDMQFALLGSGFTNIADSELKRFCIYNRALTAEEIARNYVIDKVRFNLPDAA